MLRISVLKLIESVTPLALSRLTDGVEVMVLIMILFSKKYAKITLMFSRHKTFFLLFLTFFFSFPTFSKTLSPP